MANSRNTVCFAAMLCASMCAEAETFPLDMASQIRTEGKDELIRQQQEARERERAVTAPAERSRLPLADGYPLLPDEQPCFRIERFVLELPETLSDAAKAQGASLLPMDRFAFARDWLGHYTGKCIGKHGLDVLLKGLSQQMLSRGYVTTRVLLREQDLSAGVVTLVLVPGVIRRVRFADDKLRGTWKTAFPSREGDVLNLRDVEQGLEQMKRVANQDVSMEIVPADVPGESDIVLEVRRSKPWTVVSSIDNAGTRATGKLQGSVSIGINNPLGLNDILNLGVSHDLAPGDKRLNSQGWNGFYSMPWGYWTATVSAYTSRYYQQIVGINQTFFASGNSKTVDFKLNRVLLRTQNDVLGMHMRLTRRFGLSFIEDAEIPEQRRNDAVVELGLTDRHYFGGAQFDGVLAYRQGVGGFGVRDDTKASSGGPTSRYRMVVFDGNLSVPLAIAGQALRYVTTIHGQYSGNTLYYTDGLTIGSRYTVRGFDGETMLSATRGFYWRNELQVPIARSSQSMYAGIDYGQVWGPRSVPLAGTQLAGAVIGMRGSVASRGGVYAYDLFAGMPLYKPAGFPTASVTVGFQATAQF